MQASPSTLKSAGVLSSRDTAAALPDKRQRLNQEKKSEKPTNQDSAKKSTGGLWNLLKNYAKIVDSRESVYRIALDLFAFDLPTIAAASTRNWFNFAEASFEAFMGTSSLWLAPMVTAKVGDIASKFLFTKEEQKDAQNMLKFKMTELHDNEASTKDLARIGVEESADQERIAKLYADMGKEKLAKEYTDKANSIKDFAKRFKVTDKLRDKIYKLKKTVILAESFFEGGLWGAMGLLMRGFRKYVLGVNRFTGTMAYLKNKDSKKLGQGDEMTLFQKAVGGICVVLSPILNNFLLKLTKDPKAVKNSKFLSMINEHFDMTHGLFPKLGLLFSYTTLPKWTGLIATAQGWTERIERILKLIFLIGSWWMGHRITNGLLAKAKDKELVKKYGIEPGLMVEPQHVKPKDTKGLSIFDRISYFFPEPARIHHILEKSKDNPELQKEASNSHPKILYAGLALHSALVWLMTMFVNKITKMRVIQQLNSSK